MGNNAIYDNAGVGAQANLAITDRGSDWYYTVCAIMGFSTIVFIALGQMKVQSHRLFHYITASITAVACIAYFAMGSALGQTPVLVEFVRSDASVAAAGTREMFYARYIDWVITTPLLLLDLMLTAGIPTPTILVTLLADEIMIACGLIGALTPTSYKWGFWTFGTIAFLYVVYNLIFDGRKHANAIGGAPKTAFNICGVWLVLLWFLYPIAWGLSEGGNVIHPDSEAIFYGILDVLAKPGFGALLLFLHRGITPAGLGLHIREPVHTGEKHSGATVGANDGVTGTNGSGAAATTAPAAGATV